MNRTKTIAAFAGIFAIAMTAFSLSSASASPMAIASIPELNEGNGMNILGHVEYTVYDSDMNVKNYLQSDNIVVHEGKDCAGRLLFGAGAENSSQCSVNAAFNWIAIGNGTSGGEAVADEELDFTTTGCAATSAPGELARKQVTPTTLVAATGAAGTQIELDVGTDTFKFTGHNATTTNTITQSGLFNADPHVPSATTGECGTYTGANDNMFAIKELTSGVAVTAGDSLAVKWTITIN